MDKRGRVVISVVVLFVLLITISSYFVLATETNTKTYDSSTRTVTIRNGTVDVAKIKLDTPLVYNVIRGKDRLVAEFTIDNTDTYTKGVLSNIDFYNIKDNSKPISRTFTYKYKVLTGTRDIPYYQQVCGADIINANGTSRNCTSEIAGYNKENFYDWKDFKPEDLSNFPKGETTIGIFTDVLPDESVEWQPTLYGVKITEWAAWTESLSVGLVGYFPFEETGAVKYSSIYETTNQSRNISCDGAYDTLISCPDTVIGKHGSAVQFIPNDLLAGPDTLFPTITKNMTICFWMNTSNENAYLVNIKTAGGEAYNIQTITGTRIIIDADSSGFESLTTNSSGDGISWIFVCNAQNSTDNTIWLNGTVRYTHTDGFNLTGDARLKLGGYGDGDTGHAWTGQIDELMFWNRTLTDAEVAYLYDGGTGTFYSSDNPPSIILNSPADKTNFSVSSVIFNCSATDDNMIQNVSLWIDGTRNYTLTNGTDNYTELYIERTLGDGIYDWTCSAYDNASKIAWGINRTLMIDTTPPSTTQPIITPSNPTTNDNLQCYATLTDNLQTNLIAYWKWYKNGIDYLSGSSSATNGVNSLITNLSAGNLSEGDNWTCEVKPFNGYQNGTASNSLVSEIGWGITFNVTDSFNNAGLNNVLIRCNQTGFSQNNDPTPNNNTYGPYGFSPGSYSCEFAVTNYYNKTINFVTDVNKTIPVAMSLKGGLTIEEHTWLEAIYNCLYSGNCGLYNQLLQVNQTLNNVSQTVNQDHVLTQALNNCIINGDCSLYNTLINVNQTVSSSATLTQALNNCIINGDCSLYNTLMNINQTVDNNYALTQATYQCINLGNCTLYNTIMNINNNTINSLQEYTWLQAIYACTNTGNCTLYNNLYATLVQINQTLVNVWQNIMPTNQSVVIYENITNKSAGNLTINYTINIPIKAGYASGAYLPVRIGFWFLNVSDNKTCLNQGAVPVGVIGPYCQPLITEVIGPMGGQVNFTVKLKPNATSGNYTIKRTVDIDPNGVWINYGQDIIGTIEVKDNNPNVNTNSQPQPGSQQQSSQISSSSGGDSSSSSKKVTNVYNNNYYTTENGETGASQTPSGNDGVIHLTKPTGTGGVIGTLISQGQIMITLGIIGGIIIAFILSRTIIKLKKK